MAKTSRIGQLIAVMLLCIAGFSNAAFEEKPISLESNDQFMQILGYAEANQRELDFALGPLIAPSNSHADEKVVALKVAELNKMLAERHELTNNEKAYINELIGDLYLTIRYNDPRYLQFYFNAGSALYSGNPIGTMPHARGVELLKRYYLSQNKLQEWQKMSSEATEERNLMALNKLIGDKDSNSYCRTKKRVLFDEEIAYLMDRKPIQRLKAKNQIESAVSKCFDTHDWIRTYRDYARYYAELDDQASSLNYHAKVVSIYESEGLTPDLNYVHDAGMVLKKLVYELANDAKTFADRHKLMELHAPIEQLYSESDISRVRRLQDKSNEDKMQSTLTLPQSKLEQAQYLVTIIKQWIDANPNDDIAESTYVNAIRRIDDRPAIDYAFRKISQSKSNDYWALTHAYSLLSHI